MVFICFLLRFFFISMLVNHWTYFIFLVHLFNTSASDCIFCLVCHVSLFWLEEIGFWWGRGVFVIENGWGKLEGHILVSLAHRQKEVISRIEMSKHNRIPVSQFSTHPFPFRSPKGSSCWRAVSFHQPWLPGGERVKKGMPKKYGYFAQLLTLVHFCTALI